MKYALEFHLEVTETHHRSPRKLGAVKSDLQVGDTKELSYWFGIHPIQLNRVFIHLNPLRLSLQR